MAHATYTKMTEKETMESFIDGLKKAASCARELAEALEDPAWTDTANMLDAMRENGYKLSRMRDMTKDERALALNLKASPINGVNMNPLKTHG